MSLQGGMRSILWQHCEGGGERLHTVSLLSSAPLISGAALQGVQKL